MHIGYLVAASALIGLLPMPYVGYTVVRILVSGFCLLGLLTKSKGDDVLNIKYQYWLVAIGILYNPIFPIFLTRGIWIIIDIAVAILMISAVKNITANNHINDNAASSRHLENAKTKLNQIEKKADKSMNSMILWSLALLFLIFITNILLK